MWRGVKNVKYGKWEICLITAMLASACTSYIGISRDADGTLLVSYKKDYWITSTNGIYECVRHDGGLICHDLKVTETKGKIRPAAKAPETKKATGTAKFHIEVKKPVEKTEETLTKKVALPPAKPGEMRIELGSFDKIDEGRDQVMKCIGRKIHIIKNDSQKLTGIMVGSNSDKIILRVEESGTQGVDMLDIAVLDCLLN